MSNINNDLLDNMLNVFVNNNLFNFTFLILKIDSK